MRANVLFRLSAYLLQYTGDQTYGDWARISHEFVQSHLYDETRGCIMDNFDLSSCQLGDDWPSTYDTGLYLEGLTVLANVTGNTSLVQL